MWELIDSLTSFTLTQLHNYCKLALQQKNRGALTSAQTFYSPGQNKELVKRDIVYRELTDKTVFSPILFLQQITAGVRSQFN